MLMTPQNQVEEVGQESLWDVVGWSSLGSVLMENKNVEPTVPVLWCLKYDLEPNIIIFIMSTGYE